MVNVPDTFQSQRTYVVHMVKHRKAKLGSMPVHSELGSVLPEKFTWKTCFPRDGKALGILYIGWCVSAYIELPGPLDR